MAPPRSTRSSVDEIDVDEVDVVDTASVAPIIEPVDEPAVERAAEPRPASPRPAFTDDRATRDLTDESSRPRPPRAPTRGCGASARTTRSSPPIRPTPGSSPCPASTRTTRAIPGPKTELFTPDLDESPLGEPDEEADAAMRAFFERDLDDPARCRTGGRFGRRR